MWSELAAKEYDVILLAAADHYDGTDNHGTYQIFKSLQHLGVNCAYLCTLDKRMQHEDNYDISDAIPARLIDARLIDPSLPRARLGTHPGEVNLNCLPKHRKIILGDRSDLPPYYLAKVLESHNSEVIYYSMVHNIVSGGCSYPGEYNCEKYRSTESPCHNCSEIYSHGAPFSDNLWGALRYLAVSRNMETYAKFYKDYSADKITICSASSYSHTLVENSPFLTDARKVIIPLKTVWQNNDVLTLKKHRKQHKEALLASFSETTGHNFEKICVWSAFDVELRRKGFYLYQDILHNLLYEQVGGDAEELKKILFVVVGNHSTPESLRITDFEDPQMSQRLVVGPPASRLPINTIFTGPLNRSEINELLYAADLYCSTTIADAGPRTIPEAMSWGAPVISYDKCVAPDLVGDGCGLVIKTGEIGAYAKGIKELLSLDEDDRDKYFVNCINAYKEFYDDAKLAAAWGDVLGMDILEVST